MNRNIMDALGAVPDGGSPQHGFPLSNFVDYHKKGGQFMVIGCRDTVPNATYRMAVDGFTRSLPCNTANFAHLKENYYFVHVPLSLINRNAYQLQVDRKQEYSALDMSTRQFPSFDLSLVFQRLIDLTRVDINNPDHSRWRDIHGFNMAYGAIKLLDMLGYGYIGDIVAAIDAEKLDVTTAKRIVQGLFSGKRPSANRIGAYQCIWYHFFRNDIYDNSVSAKCFNFDDVTFTGVGIDEDYDILNHRTLDDFIHDCLQLRYVPYKKDIFTAAMPGTQFGPVSSVQIGSISGLSAQFVGSPTNINLQGSTGLVPTDQFDVENPSSFTSTDEGQWEQDRVPNSMISNNSLTPLDIGPQRYSHDPATVVPSHDEGFSDVSGLSLSGLNGNTYLGAARHTHDYMMLDHKHSVNISSTITPQGTVNLSGTSGTSLFDVLQLVEAQAVQKWRQKSMLAGNRTADQFRAHHGVVPKHLLDHLPDFIGSVDNEIHITEITSTADTKSDVSENNLGDIRGRGYGASDSRTFTFQSDDYGILFLCSAIVPESTYDSFGIDFGNTMISYTDYFQNEFENIGLQAVPKYLVAPAASVDTPNNPSREGTNTFNDSDGVIGYAPRYFNYKFYPSKVHGLFNGSRLLIDGYGHIDIFGYADMQSFVMPRTDFSSVIQVHDSDNVEIHPLDMTLGLLYVSPRVFNTIFDVLAGNDELSDTFFSHVRFICEASQPMSVLGLPQF